VTAWEALAAGAAALAVLLARRPRSRVPVDTPPVVASPGSGRLVPGRRLLLAVLAGLGAWVVVGGVAGAAAGLLVTLAAGRVLTTAEPRDVRRRRQLAARELPAVVELLAATLRAGASPGEGLGVVCDAVPGPVADRLSGVRARLALGAPPADAWRTLADDPVLSPLGRALGRAESTGASVVTTVERLADELEERELSDVEERARSVGVRAALPLGLCLLPAFILLGIVPTVAGLLGSLLP